MSLWVVIPVKPLRRSKSKLTNVLSEEERTILNFQMYENTLKVLSEIDIKAYSAQKVLILPADLPLINKEDLEGVMEYEADGPFMLISPDRKMSGTNLLYISPPDLIEFSFGIGSFERHVRQAQLKNATIEVRKFSGSDLDIDSPEDLELYQKLISFESKNQYLNI